MNLIISILLLFILLLSFVAFLYFYRKKTTPIKYKNNEDLDLFLRDLKLYMQHHHPKIDINYNAIEKIKNEDNLDIKEVLIIENIVEQFINFKYSKTTQKALPRDNYWANYLEKSVSAKLPNDWLLRKEYAWRRDNKCCNRCGKNIELKESHTIFVNDIANGGGYHLENIITLCVDCNKILNANNSKSRISSLPLSDKLLMLVKES